MSLSVAREIAYDAFVATMFNRHKPESYLEKAYKEYEKKLKRVDRNFIKEVLYGGLRWHSKLYWILQNTSKRDLDKSPGEVVASLVLGTYQIYYMDRVPDRAAVNESVEYVRKKGQANACSFVNGILRQIARRGEYFTKPNKETQPIEYLSLQFAHPHWLVERWLKSFKFDRTSLMLAANNKPPICSIRINSVKTPIEKVNELQNSILKDEGIHSDRRPLRSALRLKSQPITAPKSLFAEGYFTIQDEASQLIAHMVAPEQGQHVADSCSGPGGKLSHLYEIGAGTLSLTAIEKDSKQLEKAQKTMRRLGHDNLTWVHSSFLDWEATTKQDKLLLDAPCTGLGILRRHPEGKWIKTKQAINTMATKQWDLIQHALKQIKTGGELIYSVCSFEPEESDAHARNLVKHYGDQIEVLSPKGRIPDYFRKYVTKNNVLSIFSGNSDDMDGFSAFIVKIKKDLGD